MDKYQLQIEQLASRIRSLEMERLPSGLPDEMREMIEEMDLVPMRGHDAPYRPEKLTEDRACAILEELGYTCRQGSDYVQVRSGESLIQVNLDSLPMISVTNGFLLDETEGSMDSLRRAAAEFNNTWGMAKVFIAVDESHVMVYLFARHADVLSFKDNISFYIDTVGEAMEDLRRQYKDLERERLMNVFKTRTGKNILS